MEILDRSRRASRLALVAVAALLYAGVAQNSFVDPDLFHEVALIRESLAQGALVTRDAFAYTPTIEPSIHHEWGTGAVLYGAIRLGGDASLLLLRDLLVVAIAWLTFRCARRRGAHPAVLACLLPVAVLLSWSGFTTVRAQMFSLLMTAGLLTALTADDRGRRRWIGAWLIAYVAWVNLHAGFVAGLLLFGVHVVERLLARRRIAHLLGVGAAMALLVLANPYGLDYLVYLRHALVLDRVDIEEWRPLREGFGPIVVVYVVSIALAAYALVRRGWRDVPGLGLVAASAFAAWQHQRHASLYAVVWACVVPALVSRTPLGRAVRDLFGQRGLEVRRVATAVLVACCVGVVVNEPWRLQVPASPGDHPRVTYPVGAVEHLARTGFSGNLMVPFTEGAFVSWTLHPRVMVSIDGRFEVAYPPGALRDNRDLYAARPGWPVLLAAHPTDAVLCPAEGPLAGALAAHRGWRAIYRDDAYDVYVRAEDARAIADRRGQPIEGVLPEDRLVPNVATRS